MPFPLNRVDGTAVLPLLRADMASLRNGEAMIELPLFEGFRTELYFPAPSGKVEPEWLMLAKEVLTHLTAMDNEVQQVSESQWSKSPYPSSHYEGELVYITLAGPSEAVLHYDVVGCNAEWDERFVLTEGRWVRVP
jgi:hypothetical protein